MLPSLTLVSPAKQPTRTDISNGIVHIRARLKINNNNHNHNHNNHYNHNNHMKNNFERFIVG